MGLFGLGKKKEEVQVNCECGGTCESKTSANMDSECCCGGNCDSDMEIETESFCSINVEQKKVSTVKVLGSGCAKCNQLEAATKEALENLGMNITIEHVTDFTQIAAYGVMSTPALVVDDKVVSYGKVLKTEEVVKILEKMKE
jgi:small redox-active disulfide protein 2